jgi:hypothetical protein
MTQDYDNAELSRAFFNEVAQRPAKSSKASALLCFVAAASVLIGLLFLLDFYHAFSVVGYIVVVPPCLLLIRAGRRRLPPTLRHVQKTFPQLRKIWEERALTWTEVDWRWDVKHPQKAEGEVLAVGHGGNCRCRSYFKMVDMRINERRGNE